MADFYDTKALNMIPKRQKNSNKGSFGHVLVVAGSEGMAGAAFLSSLAAYKTGAGLVRIFTPECNRYILQTLIPEAIVDPYNEEAVLNREREYTDKLESLISWASVIVLGPGMGISEWSEIIVEDILEAAYMPLIVDADAINIIANKNELIKYYREQIIITPHPGEMSRLVGIPIPNILKDTEHTAASYATKHGITCILKSSESIVANSEGRTYINTSGTPALAKAGSGDVLTGVIAGLVGLGLDNWKASTLGCYIHGRAGYMASKGIYEHGILAREVAYAIPEAMRNEAII